MSVHFSSASPEWYTPDEVLALVRQVAPIGLDPCSSGRDSVGAARRYTVAENGLDKPWIVEAGSLVYVNPPYGRGIGKWVNTCLRWGRFVPVLALLPARVDTSWFQDVWLAKAVCFWRGRLKFSGHANSAPFPSALALWAPGQGGVYGDEYAYKFNALFSPYGKVITP